MSNNDLKFDNELGKRVYEQNYEVHFSKIKNDKSKAQVNFLGDADLLAVLNTYKTMTGETQKSLIQRAVYELVKREYPVWFDRLNFKKE